MEHHILVVDGGAEDVPSVVRGLEHGGFQNVQRVWGAEAAEALCRETHFDAVLIDVTALDTEGCHLVEGIKEHCPDAQCLLIMRHDGKGVHIHQRIRQTADDLIRHTTQEGLLVALRNALERKRFLDILDLHKAHRIPELICPDAFSAIPTKSTKMKRVLKEAEVHALGDQPVLITGEDGTGKELLAQSIHSVSSRRRRRFTVLTTDLLTESLLDMLCDVRNQAVGRQPETGETRFLQWIHGGTLLVKEIGRLPGHVQSGFLKAVQAGQCLCNGLPRPQEIDVRLIGAASYPVDTSAARRSSLGNLTHHFKGTWLHLPPLRERREDIPVLISQIMETCSNGSPPCLTQKAMSMLVEYDYPGNVRELRSVIRSAVNLARDGILTSKELEVSFHLPQAP